MNLVLGLLFISAALLYLRLERKGELIRIENYQLLRRLSLGLGACGIAMILSSLFLDWVDAPLWLDLVTMIACFALPYPIEEFIKEHLTTPKE